MRNILRFMHYVKKHRRLLILAIITGIIRYVIPLSIPLAIRILVDRFLIPGIGKRVWELHILMGGLCFLYIVYALTSYFRSYFVGILGHRIISDLRRDLYLHLQKMSLSYFSRRRVGEVVSRMTGDISSAQNIVSSAIINAVMDTVLLLLLVLMLFAINIRLTLISISIIPFYILAHSFLSKQIRATSYNIHNQAEKISGELHEQFSAVSTIQAFNQEYRKAYEFEKQSRKYFWALRSNLKFQAIALGFTGFLTSLGPTIGLWAGALEVLKGRLTIGALMSFYAYLGMFYQPIQRLADLKLVFLNSLASIDRIFEVFDTYPEIHDLPDAVDLKNVRGEITFNNITFNYEGSEPIFKNLSIKVPPCSTLALVGQSGCGKSSLASLILRFYDIDEGSILIDGYDIRKITLRSLRESIAFVAQNPILLSGTIEENLRLGKLNASFEEIEDAARRAYAHIFIEKLPKGYQTEIGERGFNLSGGEKQRIAIARAFLKNSPILIFDEPTSALDSTSEEFIKLSLRELTRDRTTIIIAHRLTTIEFADYIFAVNSKEYMSKNIPQGLRRSAQEKAYF
ncbi:MAG: ABC transporter ATP-binding protein [Candidatus Omnitrophota bacterium]